MHVHVAEREWSVKGRRAQRKAGSFKKRNEKREEKEVQKKRSTGPSRVVPHRSTTPARTCLTSLFGWEAVSQADVAALSMTEEKHLMLWPLSLWPSHSFGGPNLIKNCPPVPTMIACTRMWEGYRRHTLGTRDQSYTQEGCAARCKQGSVARVSKQRAHSASSRCANAAHGLLIYLILSTAYPR